MKINRLGHMLISVLGSFLFVLALLILFSSSTGVQASQPATIPALHVDRPEDLSSGSVITIGVAAALNFEGIGWPEANAVQLAISQTNAAGGINIAGVDYTLTLVTANDLCDATQAITVAQTAAGGRDESEGAAR